MEPGSRRNLSWRWEAVARETGRDKAAWRPVWLFPHNLWVPLPLRSVRRGHCALREVSQDSRFTCNGLSCASVGDGGRRDVLQEMVPGNHGRPLGLTCDYTGPGQCCPGEQQVWMGQVEMLPSPSEHLTFKVSRGLALVSDPGCTSLHPTGPVCSRSARTFLSPTAVPLLLAIPLPGAWQAGRTAGARTRAGKRKKFLKYAKRSYCLLRLPKPLPPLRVPTFFT